MTTTPTQTLSPAPLAPISPSKWLGRVKYSDDLNTSYLRLLAYGPQGCGKTNLLATFPKPFVLDADRGLLTARYKHIPGFTFEYGEETFKILMELLGDMKMKRNGFGPGEQWGDIQTVGIDTVTKLSEKLMHDAMLHPATGGKALDPVNSKPEWDHYAIVKERLSKIIDLIMSLPMHVVVTAWVETEKDESTGAMVARPSLTGKFREVIAGNFDEFYYMDVQQGNPTKYFVRTSKYGIYTAKSRLGLPPSIENPTFEALQKALREGAAQ